MRRGSVLLGLGFWLWPIFLVASAGDTSAFAGFKPEFVEQACPFAHQGEYPTDLVTCGYVLVPEDRTSATSRTIRLSVMRIAAQEGVSAPEPLVSLSGGPGLPAVTLENALRFTGAEGTRLRSVAELILFDQRGVGYSSPDFCRAIPDAHQYGVRRSPDGEQLLWSNLQRCLGEAKQQGVALEAYSSWHSAHDVKDLRQALGYDAWNIFGVSYGTELGQAVFQVDGPGTRSAILDSVVPILPHPEGGWSSYAAAYRNAFERVAASCAGHPDCRAVNGDLATRLFAAIKTFEAEPEVFDGLPDTTYANGRAVLDDQLAATFALVLLYDVNLLGDLPALVLAYEQRDRAALRAYLQAGAAPIDHGFGTGMGVVANCRGASVASAAQVAFFTQREPDLSRWVDVLDWSDDCAAVFPHSVGPAVSAFASNVPTLIAAGAFDPVTPPEFAKALLPSLPNAQYVEFPHAGHVAVASYLDGCGGDLIATFLQNPTQVLDTRCVESTPAPSWLMRFRSTKGAFEWLSGVQAGELPLGLGALVAGLACMILFVPMALVTQRFETSGVRRWRKQGVMFCWLAALGSLLALGCTAAALVEWMQQHPLALPLGVPSELGVPGWIGLLSMLLVLWGVVQWSRAAERSHSVGMVALLTLLLVTGSFGFLVWIGASPVWI